MTDDREWGEDGEIDLFKGVLFLWRFRYLLIALPLVFALVGWIAATRLVQKEYTANTTVLVSVPSALSNLVPDPTDVDSVDRLARSQAIRALVEERLAAEQRLSNGETISTYKTVVDKSLDSPRPTLSVLTLTVIASNPELAQRAANLWAETVVKEEAAMAEGTRKAAMTFFDRQYKEAAARLVESQRTFDAARQRRDGDVPLASAELDNAKADFKRAGKRRDEAQLVMADRAAAVQAGTPAPLPGKPSGPRVARTVILSAGFGFVLALFIAWVYSRIQK